MATRHIAIYDTTLRDGAQGEGISFSGTGKVKLARKLDEFGVDYIEGGFPGSNPKDMEFFQAMREAPLAHARVVAFGSTRRKRVRVDADPYVKSLLDACTPAVTIFGKTWKLHVKDVLRTTEKENLAMIGDTIGYLKDHNREVLFDAEHFFDGFKDDPDFAMRVLDRAAAAGADVVVLCDTNGGCMPHEIFDITRAAVAASRIPVGIHTHNDCGVGVANALEGIRAGAGQVQGTINGYGERCGNANLCTIMPNIQFKLGFACGHAIDLTRLRGLSFYVDELVNLRSDTRAPYVGHSAFAHKGGPHVNAVEKNPRTFEHIAPACVGNERHILVSELSGGSSILLKAIELGAGATTSKEEAREILGVLKALESKGYAFEAADASFRILIQKVLREHKPFFELEGFRVVVEKRGTENSCLSEASIKVRVKGEIEHTVAEGDGPVNALDGALRKALMRFYPAIAKVQLTDFRVRILDPEEATAAKTQVLIESSDGKESWGTVGVSENIIEASWEALVDSVEYKLFQLEAEANAKAKRSKRKTRPGKARP
jgi:2-isopropylmalate synthase